MGSNCSSRQNHKDRDSISTRSEESPSYQIAQDGKKDRFEIVPEAAPSRHSEMNASKKSAAQESVNSDSVATSVAPATPVPAAQIKKDERPPELANYKERKIVIYISASDSQDCKVEKALVHTEIYPELRKYCKALNFELHIVDLHWSDQDKSSEPEELFLHELSRQTDGGFFIPLVFLNTSLGRSLLPKTLESADFQTVSGSESGSILLKWYVLDSDAQPPCYRLLPATTHIRGLKSQNSQLKEVSLKQLKGEVDSILNVMLATFTNELRDSYLTTVVEQEVQNCVLMSRELAKRCVWFSRSSQFPDTDSPAESELRRRCENLQKALKNELQESHIVHLTPSAASDVSEQPKYLENVSTSIRKHLKTIIDGIVEEAEKSPLDQRMSREIAFHRRAAMKEAQMSVNRQQLVEIVFSWNGTGPIVFHGPGGCGKTALLSRLAHHLEKTEKTVFYRKVGLTRQSSTVLGLLQSLTKHLDPGKSRRIHRVDEYAKILPDCISSCGKDVFIIIDGLDQFSDQVDLSWIPNTLPENSRLILSMETSLVSKIDPKNANIIEILNLDKSERDSILMSSILEYNHSYNPEMRNLPETCTLPLHIKVVAWQATWSKEYNLNLQPKNQLKDQLEDMLDQLETIFGKEKIEKCLSYLLGTKYGVQDSEMIDLLSSDETFHTNAYLPWAGSYLFWSKITRHLGPFLEWGDRKTLKIRDKTLSDLCRARYSAGIVEARKNLKKYFSGCLWDKENKSRQIDQSDKYEGSHNIRKYEELPFLTVKTEGSAKSLSLDVDWAVAKISATSAHQLLEDLLLEEETPDVAWLKLFIEENEEALSYEGSQFYTLAYKHFFVDGNKAECQLAIRIQEMCQNPPVDSLIQVKNEDGETQTYNMMRRLPKSSNYVVAICTEKNEITLFNVANCCKVRTLNDIQQPTDLKMVNDETCVVLSGRELSVYDLSTGALKTKLKGVMNQKMPFFELHDENHLVALSRNRMYVNLMNLESGDCVTTFKAGEDRFLNSLLVSGDGKILVCGDETQKPSPMLVWNLASRKLLYDIRIPQHEFISRLSAITYQGNYVCFVTKEVDNGPNYLVVYDLQSGTLFKKWKPGVNTTAVEISPKEGCLITGLEDSRILIWDLITGNCRNVLRGHTSACDRIRLDEQGKLCVSWSTREDRSIRIWDLSNGQLVAAYTPDNKPVACEIAAGYLVVATDRFITLKLKGPSFQNNEEPEDKSIYR